MRPSTPIALLALFLALSGGAYAAVKLPANSVGSKQIKKKAVTLSKIAPSARRALKGATGPQGPTGQQGLKGDQGVPGQNGADGKDGAAGAPYTADSNGNVFVAATRQSSETNTIRIGTTQQTRFVAPAIANSSVGGNPVWVDADGSLGVPAPSSRRFKRAIRTIRNVTTRLMRLRPVSFRYRKAADRSRHYGLIAEDVAKLFPQLVMYGKDGRPIGVHYDELPALMLAQVQAQQRQINALRRQVARLARRR